MGLSNHTQEGHQRITVLLMFQGRSPNSIEIGSPSWQGIEFNAIENDRLIREDLLFRDSVRNAAT